MIFSSVSAEFRKQRHLHLWLIPFCFLLLLFVWTFWCFRRSDASDLAQGYTYLLCQIPLLNCVLMPVMLAVIASRLCDLEIKGQTLKLLYTLQTKGSFYDWKFLHEFLYLALFCAGEALLVLGAGRLYHFTETPDLLLLLRHFGVTLTAGTAVLTLQHFLSLWFENQIIPLLVGLAGSFLGLFSMYFPAAVARLVLWGYFGAFLPFYMEWDKDTRIITFLPQPFPSRIFALFLLFTAALYLVCRGWFFKKEV